jgi:hypothetical protein
VVGGLGKLFRAMMPLLVPIKGLGRSVAFAAPARTHPAAPENMISLIVCMGTPEDKHSLKTALSPAGSAEPGRLPGSS